jgi:hypothetical protein
MHVMTLSPAPSYMTWQPFHLDAHSAVQLSATITDMSMLQCALNVGDGEDETTLLVARLLLLHALDCAL